mmetsp:Transcript_25971/g.70390  ORF Transcript_25971/g.70390 Transcript_25971/m.70390 type:complete len:311 (+) Transcript_25971:1341-2273(+)
MRAMLGTTMLCCSSLLEHRGSGCISQTLACKFHVHARTQSPTCTLMTVPSPRPPSKPASRSHSWIARCTSASCEMPAGPAGLSCVTCRSSHTSMLNMMQPCRTATSTITLPGHLDVMRWERRATAPGGSFSGPKLLPSLMETVDRRKLETYWGLSTLHTSGALAAYLARSAGPFGGESADLPAGSRLVRAKAELLLPLHNASTAASTAASAAGGSALEPAGSAAPCPSAAPSPSCESADPTAGCSPAALPTEHEDTVEGDCGSGSLPHASPCCSCLLGAHGVGSSASPPCLLASAEWCMYVTHMGPSKAV